MLRSGDGRRYVFGQQVATVIADFKSTGDVLELTTISGGKGETFPLHRHKDAFESIYVMEGKIEFMLDGVNYLLTAGDYVHIPPGIAHAYRMAGHRNRFASYSIKGNLTAIYELLGEPYPYFEHPTTAMNSYSENQLTEASNRADIVFLQDAVRWGSITRLKKAIIQEA